MERLPLSVQDFRALRQEGRVYIDKTQFIHQMVDAGKYYFLSRPRRFGKTLLVSTLTELFQGSQELFQGLWIANRWDWQQKYPVIKLVFNKASYKQTGLEAYISKMLAKEAGKFSIVLDQGTHADQLKQFIEALAARHGKVVVLVDEYDKPIIDYLHDVPAAEQNREILKNFYSVLNPLEAHLKFVFMTGVSKFSRVSIFSELNNLIDLTMHPRFATLLGYTQRELEAGFSGHIHELAPSHGGREALLQQITRWYNGYSWNGRDKVYNPWSVLNFLHTGIFRNFWFESGTPTFLIKLLNKAQQYQLSRVQATEASMSSFELGNVAPFTLLFQTGYLTILTQETDGVYTLGYPNNEVRRSLLQYLLAEAVHGQAETLPVHAVTMKNALQQQNPQAFVEALNALFASIPYQIMVETKEAYYHTVLYLALSLMGTYIQAEPSQAIGRPDCVAFVHDAVYIIEIKIDSSAIAAMEQIKTKNYAAPYTNQNKTTYALALNINTTLKAVNDWLVEAV